MGFRRANSTQGNTNCQKSIFEDDQVKGHHPRALRHTLKVQFIIIFNFYVCEIAVA